VSLILTADRTRQPIGAVRLNRAHPLARGLVSLASAGSGLQDLASGRTGTPTALSGGLTPLGRSWNFDGNTTLIDYGLPTDLPDLSGTYTMAAWVVANTSSPARTIAQLYDGVRNTHICYVPNNSYLGLESAAAGSGLSVAVSNGRPCLIIGSAIAGAPIDVYVNGVRGQNNGSSGITASTQAGYTLGKRIGGTSFGGQLLLAAVWNRFLTVEEKLLFTRNPWAMFKPRRIWIDYPIAAGGSVSAEGSLPSISLSAATGSATGAATASAALPAASLSAPTGAATGSANTGGSLAPLSLSAPAGSAAGAATASASLPTSALSAPTGTAVGACVASGAISGLSIAPPTGTAFSGAGTVANGVLSQISLSAPTGGATGNAAATGALQGISLFASLSSASGAASCSGALPTISITPCSGSASTAVPASRASGSVFCRIDTPRAVVRIATSQCTVRVP